MHFVRLITRAQYVQKSCCRTSAGRLSVVFGSFENLGAGLNPSNPLLRSFSRSSSSRDARLRLCRARPFQLTRRWTSQRLIFAVFGPQSFLRAADAQSTRRRVEFFCLNFFRFCLFLSSAFSLASLVGTPFLGAARFDRTGLPLSAASRSFRACRPGRNAELCRNLPKGIEFVRFFRTIGKLLQQFLREFDKINHQTNWVN